MLLDLTLDEIRQIGEDLVGTTVKVAQVENRGGNNRVFRLDHAKESFALKFYPPQDDDPRDRLGTEWRALSFMITNGMDFVPRPLAQDANQYCALYQWIEGTHVQEATPDDIDGLVGFLEILRHMANKEGAQEIGPASAACFSPDETLEQLQERLNRLNQVACDFPQLKQFLDDDFSPCAESMTDQAQNILQTHGPSQKVLSPSDFGFHNALRRPDGRLVFLDFEYFGWDSPEKMLSDVMLHPGMALSDELSACFFKQAKPIFAANDPAFDARFHALHPLYGLIWCLILLNEYLPERWKRRNIGQRQNDKDTVRANQLTLAHQRLDSLKKTL